MTSSRRTASLAYVMLLLAMVIAGCGITLESSPAENGPSPSAGDGMAVTDLSAIGCARNDPADEGELTGAWAGNDSGVYYIRQVGDCVWWFGTEVRDIEPGATGQRGFANVPSGRMVGTQVDLEWVDVPLGNTVNIEGSMRLLAVLAALADHYASVLGMHVRVLRTAIAGHGGATPASPQQWRLEGQCERDI